MTANLQYELETKNGETVKETGHFYPAIEFYIESESNKIICNLTKTHTNAVIYRLTQDNTVIEELSHPDYVPETTPGKYVPIEKIDENHQFIYAALVKLNISKDKTYKQHYSNEDTLKKISFKVTQSHLKA